jgi:transcriptional regulator with XRE-family HTH domain
MCTRRKRRRGGRRGMESMSGTAIGGTAASSTGLSGTPASSARRTELAAFLRSRRERVRPEDVGLLPGQRRRTAGLRREEVAQLAGVGVTWYTWLEQGRPIHASVQVLDAVARTLMLDQVERAYLFRLADVPGAAGGGSCDQCPLPPEVQQVLDGLVPMPASVVTERFDLLAWNRVYAALFPHVTSEPPGERNTLLSCVTRPVCCSAIENRDDQFAGMVAQLRAAYGRNVGDPAWTHFISRLEAASPEFTRAWAAHDVALPASYAKIFRHPRFGRVEATSASFAVQAVPGARLVVYTPADDHARAIMARLAAGEGVQDRFPCWSAHEAAREAELAAV